MARHNPPLLQTRARTRRTPVVQAKAAKTMVKNPVVTNLSATAASKVVRGGRWIPLRQILQSQPIAKRPTGAIGYEELRKWWIARGERFDFLALPGELRNEVYQYLVCTFVYLYLCRGRNTRDRLTEWGGIFSTGLLESEYGPTGTHVRTKSRAGISVRQGVLNGAQALGGLLLSSKHMHYEVSGLLWKGMGFPFQERWYGDIKLERFA
ncbi:uncharacterized protein BDZ99DRAFT_519553 [Mytilinidion resinicola]|uniref:Uncharacterized protein n=1 Tax=Mytilinidion resinicola TaxID=574789 RepID=A0A6A6YPR8_9PEZI|nr:uncharacterized protein BDZ99DRAFT_519553 [Mytilinidion resinicola]KAF2810872.1 hypothetical protein BDZ99DRAFT_519553 [Mytilinidion resinicola]